MDILWEKFLACTPRQKGCVILKLVLGILWLGWLTGTHPATWIQLKTDAEYHRDLANFVTLKVEADRAYGEAVQKSEGYSVRNYYAHLKYLTIRLKELDYPRGKPGAETGREMVERYTGLLREQMRRVNRLGPFAKPEPAIDAEYRAEMKAFNQWVDQYDPPDAVKAWRSLRTWAKHVGVVGVALSAILVLAKLFVFLVSLVAVDAITEIRLRMPALVERYTDNPWNRLIPPRGSSCSSLGRDPPDPVPLSSTVRRFINVLCLGERSENSIA